MTEISIPNCEDPKRQLNIFKKDGFFKKTSTYLKMRKIHFK